METKEKWNLIVEQYRKNRHEPESKIQNLWEMYCSEFLGYSRLFGEIDAQRTIHIGVGTRAIPDIILRKDNRDIFDIELKQYTLPFDENMEKQLKSYLDLLHISSAMIVCQKIYLYSYNYVTKESNKLIIDFDNNNEDGIKLIEILHKEKYTENIIEEFINERAAYRSNIQTIKNEINSELIKNLIKSYFQNQYAKQEIEEAIENFVFDVKVQDEPNPPKPIVTDQDFPLNPMFIIIKTTDDRVAACRGNLYDATRHSWKVRYDKVIYYPYVLSVIKGYVKEVYKVTKWQKPERWSIDIMDVSERWEFIGEVANSEIRNRWINKMIPEKFRKIGLASPTLYSDMK